MMIHSYRGALQNMRLIPVKLLLIAALPILSAFGVMPAASDSYSYEEQEACTGDALRLCSEFIPDIPRITACMQAKHDQLSPRCAKMFVQGRDRHLDEPGEHPYHEQLPSEERHDQDMQ